ncbi:MAG: ribbon-helix-helix protein, CopG family [Tagaea sp.]
MADPISVRLDDKATEIVKAEAAKRGIGLSTYIRDLVNEEAKRLRKARIRAQSKRFGELAARDPEIRAFLEDWTGGAPEEPKR